MRKKIFTTIALFTMMALTACGSDNAEKKSAALSNPTPYEKNGYSISISDNWAKTNNDNTDLAFFYKTSENDSFTESLNVITQDLSSYDYTLDTYKDLTVSQYEELDYTINECKKVTIDDIDCYKIISYTKNDETKIKCKQVFTLIDNTAYLFTFAAEDKDYDKLSDEIDAIFDTIEFDENLSDSETTSNSLDTEAASDNATSVSSDAEAASDNATSVSSDAEVASDNATSVSSVSE